jgi:hypothetical protein
MEENLSGSFCFKFEGVEDSAIFRRYPWKIDQSAQLPQLRQRSLFEADLSESNLSNELQYFEAPSYEFPCDQSKSLPFERSIINAADTTEEFMLSFLFSELNEHRTESKVSSFPRPESQPIFEESTRSLHPRSDVHVCSPSFLQINSRSERISLGFFNSISTKVTPKAQRLHKDFNSAPVSPAKCCNCQKSKCLKLYCECFANRSYCSGCSCIDCHNLEAYKAERGIMWRKINERNTQGIKRQLVGDMKREKTGCNCRRSNCIKNFCECFKKGIRCGPECNCVKCKNNTALRTITPISYNDNPYTFKGDE